MPAPGAVKKILRVGVLQGRQIVEERIFRDPETVTVGESPQNTLMVIGPELGAYPQRHALFVWKDGRYWLAFTPQMKGKLKSAQQADVALGELAQDKNARRDGGAVLVPLNEDQKGQVTISDVTFLFNFVPAPPKPVKPNLPASLRGGLLKQMDWDFMLIFAGTFTVACLFFAAASFYAPKLDTSFDDSKAQDMIRRMAPVVEDVRPPPPPEPTNEKAPTDEDNKTATDKSEKTVKKTEGQKPTPEQLEAERAKRRDAELAKARELARTVGLVAQLGVTGPGGDDSSPVSDVLGDGGRFDNTRETLNQVKGLDSRTSGLAVGKVGGGNTRTIGTVGVGTGEGGLAAGSGTGEVVRRGKIGGGSAKIAGPSGKLDEKCVKQTMDRVAGQIQLCYENELKNSPNLAGRVEVSFVVNDRGMVKDVGISNSALGNASVEQCIVVRVKGARFTCKPDAGEEVPVEFPFIFTSK